MNIRAARVRLLAVAMLMAAVSIARAADVQQNSEPLKIVHGPYLQGPRTTSMTIVWFTNKKCVSRVEYGGDDLSCKTFGAHHGLIDANDTRHVVQLDGLKPGKTYKYRVVSKEIVKFAYRVDYGSEVSSKVFSFTTPDPAKEKFSFCVVSDIHEKASQLRQMLDRIDWSGVDFMVLDGDAVDRFDRESQIFDGFLDVCVAKFAANVPYVHVRGNHETRGLQARRIFDFAPTPEGRFYYSFDHAGVHFIVLDSGENETDDSNKYSGLAAFDAYRREQAKWLQEDIAGEACRKADFRVALFHIPTHGGDNWHDELQIRKLWEPLLNQGGVDLVVCGHTHKRPNAHISPSADANKYDLVICSPQTVLRVDKTPQCLSIKFTKPPAETALSFDLPARQQQLFRQQKRRR